MKVQQAANQPPVFRTLANTPGDQPPAPEAPKDSFASAVGKETVRTAVSYANAFGTVTGGAVGVAAMVPSMYAGVLGGAVVGAALGGGFGPVIASVGSSGAMNFIGTTFTTLGVGAKAGMLIGGLAGASGGWTVGNKVGGLVGKLPGAALGAPVGALKGGWNHLQGETGAALPGAPKPSEPQAPKQTDLNKMSGVGKFAASVVSGVGLLGGATGGAAIGAGVMGAGNLVSGLLAKDVTLSAITGAAAGGAIGGAIIFGVIGAVGGWNLVKAGEGAIKGMVNKVHQGQAWLELDKKETLLNEQENKLNSLEAGTNKAHTEAVADIKNRTQELDGRQGVVGDKEGEVSFKNANQEKLSGERSEELYKDEKSRLVKGEAGLNGEKVRLDGEKQRIDTKEKEVPELVLQRSTKMLKALENDLEGKYQDRKGKLEERDRQLQREEANIPVVVQQKVDAELKPIKQDIERTKDQAVNLRRDANSARSEGSNMMAQVPGTLNQAQSERDRANRLDREADNLQPTFDGLRGEVDRSRNQLESKHQNNAGLVRDLEQCQASHKK
ncbi:hypothetical protein IV102_07345 [bacterium]|nr:hypothetical protein [bacterium]